MFIGIIEVNSKRNKLICMIITKVLNWKFYQIQNGRNVEFDNEYNDSGKSSFFWGPGLFRYCNLFRDRKRISGILLFRNTTIISSFNLAFLHISPGRKPEFICYFLYRYAQKYSQELPGLAHPNTTKVNISFISYNSNFRAYYKQLSSNIIQLDCMKTLVEYIDEQVDSYSNKC